MGWVKQEIQPTQQIFEEIAADWNGRINGCASPYEYFVCYIRDMYDVTLKQCDEICAMLKAHFGIQKFYYYEINRKTTKIMALEQILQDYFGCKRPFDKDGKLTKHGNLAVKRLISLLHNLNDIGVINGSWNAQKKIDDIIDNG